MFVNTYNNILKLIQSPQNKQEHEEYHKNRQRSVAETIAPDALHQVMDYLSPREAAVVSAIVCKCWNDMVNSADQHYWKARYQRQGGLVKDVISAYHAEIKIPPNI